MIEVSLDRRIIFALDVKDASQAKKWISLLGEEIKIFKVGLELFLKEGFALVDEIIDMGFEVMLDLKLYDIPNTVYGAVRQVVDKGVTYLTVHGDRNILSAACKAAKESGLGIVAVTLLTSMDEKDVKEMGYSLSPREIVLKRCAMAWECGCRGVVASGKEAPWIREKVGKELILITPGVRPSFSSKGDQKRVVTPSQAIANGVDHVVMGRPIREAPDPLSLVKQVKEEIAKISSRERS